MREPFVISPLCKFRMFLKRDRSVFAHIFKRTVSFSQSSYKFLYFLTRFPYEICQLIHVPYNFTKGSEFDLIRLWYFQTNNTTVLCSRCSCTLLWPPSVTAVTWPTCRSTSGNAASLISTASSPKPPDCSPDAGSVMAKSFFRIQSPGSPRSQSRALALFAPRFPNGVLP